MSERLLIPMPPETRMGLKFKQDLEMGILLSFRQGYQDKCDRLKAAFGLGGFPLHSPPPPGSLLGIFGVRISSGILWGRGGSTVWFLWVGTGGSWWEQWVRVWGRACTLLHPSTPCSGTLVFRD